MTPVIEELLTRDNLILFLLVVMLFKLEYLTKHVDSLAKRVDSLEGAMQWLLLTTPERVDFWHPRQRNIPALYDRPKNLRRKLSTHYGGAKCAVTGVDGSAVDSDNDKVVLAHLLPRNSPDIAYAHLSLNPRADRDGKRMLMFLCHGMENAYDQKKISFYQVGKDDGTTLFKMRLWDPLVREKLIHRGAPDGETIGKYEERTISFPADKTPFTRILSYHHLVCHFHAKSMGWTDEETKPDMVGSPVEDKGVPTAIYTQLDTFANDHSSFVQTSKTPPTKRRDFFGQADSGETGSQSFTTEG